MPLYEYHCEACGHRFEKIQKFSDPLIEECPKCGEKKVHKLVSSPAIQFKGTGWYITDYARKGAAGSESSSKDSDSSSGDKSSESKSAESKADSKAADSKTADSKPDSSKASEGKRSDSKSSESKSAGTKPATTT